jgi:hypothetical protein
MALEAGICYHMATLSEISLTYSRTGRRRLSTQCKAVGQEEGIALFEKLRLCAPELVLSNGAISAFQHFHGLMKRIRRALLAWKYSAIVGEFVFHSLNILNLKPAPEPSSSRTACSAPKI